MTRSSRHKSHKHSKHSSKEYSDSEEDVRKMKEKSSKDESSVRVHRDSASGEKRKISSHVREGKDSKELGGHANGEALEGYVSSKRRKEKSDVVVGGDRWNGGGDERGDRDKNVEKEMHKGESLKVDSKLMGSNKGESLRIESKSKSKRHESGNAGERNDDSLASVVLEKVESKSKGESKRKSDRDSSARKEGKESKEKDKDRRSDKDKNGVQETKIGDAEEKLGKMDVGKKQSAQLTDFSEERQGKRAQENPEHAVQEELRNPELVKEIEKRIHRKKEGSSERDKHYHDSKEGDERRLSARDERAKDVKYRDDKLKDGNYADKYEEDGHKDEKDNKHQGDKYREDGEKEARRRDDKHHEDGDRETKHKDEKHREDGERDSRRKDNKYREAIERDGRRDDKYPEDRDRDGRRKDNRYRENDDTDIKRGDERYYENGDRGDRRRDNRYRDDRHKEEKYQEDIERDVWHKDSKQGDDFDKEKRPRDTKYRDEHTLRDRSVDKSDPKRSKGDGYGADDLSKKSIAYDESPTHDDRKARYRDDQGRKRNNEKEDYGDIRTRGTRDQRSDAEKKSASSARIDLVAERVRPTSRNDVELSSGHSRRRSSPPSSSPAPRDHYRVPKQDESKYRDYNYEERVRYNTSSSRDYTGALGGSEKTSSSRSLEKIGQKDDGHLGELSAEKRLKSPSPSIDRRQFCRPVEESTQRSCGSRDVKEYPDADTSSISSPFMRNNHFSSGSKSFRPPPPFRTGVDSPSPFGSVEDDGRGKSNIRQRRFGDPNMGRIQGNAVWRGAVPNWPSPVGNGFLPFPHAPPPVGFHSVMQPFPAPPMFGVRPSMDLSHPSPYHMPSPGPPLHGWDSSNAVFGDYGRSDWDLSRNLPGGGRGWETSGDLWKGPNRTASLEMMQSSEKENNNSTKSADEALTDQSMQPAQTEQAESTVINQLIENSEKNDFVAPVITLEEIETSDVARMLKKDDVLISHVYLSKLDISADLTEPELYNKCTDLIDVDQSVLFDVYEAKILFMEEAVEAEIASTTLWSDTLFASTDGSVFQTSMSLYRRQKENFWAEDVEKLKILSEVMTDADQEDQIVEDNKTKKLDPLVAVEDSLPSFDIEEDLPVANVMEKPDEEPVSVFNHDNTGANTSLDQGLQEKPLSPVPSEVKDVPMEDTSNNDELSLVDTKFGPLVNSDVSSEAMMPESVNLISRILHSPESTH